jgi:UDP-N-acetyl-D-glucosamine dehydrogenase
VVSGKAIPRCELTEEELGRADAVLVITAHSAVDYSLVASFAPLVLDTRNVMRAFESANVVRL